MDSLAHLCPRHRSVRESLCTRAELAGAWASEPDPSQPPRSFGGEEGRAARQTKGRGPDNSGAALRAGLNRSPETYDRDIFAGWAARRRAIETADPRPCAGRERNGHDRKIPRSALINDFPRNVVDLVFAERKNPNLHMSFA